MVCKCLNPAVIHFYLSGKRIVDVLDSESVDDSPVFDTCISNEDVLYVPRVLECKVYLYHIKRVHRVTTKGMERYVL